MAEVDYYELMCVTDSAERLLSFGGYLKMPSAFGGQKALQQVLHAQYLLLSKSVMNHKEWKQGLLGSVL